MVMQSKFLSKPFQRRIIRQLLNKTKSSSSSSSYHNHNNQIRFLSTWRGTTGTTSSTNNNGTTATTTSYSSNNNHYSTTTSNYSSVMVASNNDIFQDDDDDLNRSEADPEMELYLKECMNQFLPNNSNNNRLDLELGEDWENNNKNNLWYNVQSNPYQYDEEEDDEEDISINDFSVMLEDDESSVIEEDDNDISLQQQQQLDNEESVSLHEKQQNNGKSVMELLSNFNPLNPPDLNKYKNRKDALEDMQLWIECQAQQEAVLKYQKVLNDARQRKDYSSLNPVQQQIIKWFVPLHDSIEQHQKQYMNISTNNNDNNKETKNKTVVSGKRFGPYICSLPAAKLAVITAHEAVMGSLLYTSNSSPTNKIRNKLRIRRNSKNDAGEIPVIALAAKIGQAIEDEVVVHRILHQRFLAQQQQQQAAGMSTQEDDNQDSTIEEVDIISLLKNNYDEENSNDNNLKSNNKSWSDNDDNNKTNITHKWTYATSHLKNYLDELSKYQPSAKKRRVTAYAIRKARQVLEKDEEWTDAEKIRLGATLLHILIEHAQIYENGKSEKAFSIERRWLSKNKTQSFIVMHDRLYKMIVSDKLESLAATTTRHKPMIVPPNPWSASDVGGYRMLKADLIRYHGCRTQREALHNAQPSVVFDGLNALGRVPWKINKQILEVAQKCWQSDIALGDIPTITDYELPPEPIAPIRTDHSTKPEKGTPEYERSVDEYRKYRESLMKYNRIRQKNMDLRSLRGSVMLKLDQAEKFKDFGEIYFPYNMDFRGRAYPVPPHLSNVGSDLCRGLLKFSTEKPLGTRGLYWLKVHLANFAGKDKMTFDERAQYVDDNIDAIRESVNNPFAGERWWMSLEDPFQGLATCHEIINAIDSGNPESYMCSLPVHMDGSCNGLQHYAALGRDSVGGKAVNLCNMDEPQDVYVGVMHEVIRRVAEEAERDIQFDISDLDKLSRTQMKELNHNRSAKLVNGLIDRGVVKRTVMTSVYGVTYIGARQQIEEKIEEKLEQQGRDIDEISHEVFQACGYLATVTMETIGDLFSGAKGTMNWLTTCARMITQHGYPVAWVSPIGVPAIQPYRQKKTATLVTLLQTISIVNSSDDLPIHKQRQVSAFPPNYIHSLDSSHMLLTALEMDRRGLTFSAVHDSFWTHPCDIDEMNNALREVFVDLYSQPLLEELKETWELRYPGLEFPPLPERGTLDLEEVKRAKYFFQ